jgi:hypothetical protein
VEPHKSVQTKTQVYIGTTYVLFHIPYQLRAKWSSATHHIYVCILHYSCYQVITNVTQINNGTGIS